MTSLLVHNVDDVPRARPRESAARHRRSLKEEGQALLRTAAAWQEKPEAKTLTAITQRLSGLAHSTAVTTGDVGNFEGCGIAIINPWEHGT